MISIENQRIKINVGLLIFLCFLFTGSAYITWLYHLTAMFGSISADWMSEGVGYVFQALGILIFALMIKRNPKIESDRNNLTIFIILDGIMMTVAILSNIKSLVLIFGLLMNLFHGIIAGIYLAKLAIYIPQQKKGSVFGLAYGLGCIGSWLLSLPMHNTLLHSEFSLVIYLIIIIFILILNYFGKSSAPADDVGNSEGFRIPEFTLIAFVIILLSVVKGLGFYFPISQSVSGSVSLEFTRSFYALGLIAAGFIGDKNRKYGAICCLAALIFPFISFTLRSVPDAATVLWILGYVFFGFFSVYRVVVFSDIAAKKNDLIFMSGFGLMFGRIGDAVGAVGGIFLEKHNILLMSVSAVLFVITVLLFFMLFQKLYVPVLSQEQNEEKLLSDFEIKFGLSARECDVFQLIIKGRSNAEIAGDLYISESTVKFHVKNVLKKTDCKNRTELSLKFKRK